MAKKKEKPMLAFGPNVGFPFFLSAGFLFLLMAGFLLSFAHTQQEYKLWYVYGGASAFVGLFMVGIAVFAKCRPVSFAHVFD